MRLMQLNKLNEVEVNPDLLAIEPYKNIWDSKKNKKEAMQLLAYVYYYCDFNSPYFNLSLENRHAMICRDYLKNTKFEVNEELLNCIHNYREIQTTPQLKLVNILKDKLDSLHQFIQELAITEDNVKLLLTTIKELNPISIQLASLEENIKKGLTSDNKLRGSQEKGRYEDN